MPDAQVSIGYPDRSGVYLLYFTFLSTAALLLGVSARGRFPEDEDGTTSHTLGGVPTMLLRIDSETVTNDVVLARAQGESHLINAAPVLA